jgi:cell division protein FtsQ
LRKFRNIIFWSVIGIYLIISLNFSSNESKKIKCSSIEIVIASDNQKFVKTSDIRNIIDHQSKNLTGSSIYAIDIKRLEKAVKNHPAVKDAEIYSSLTGRLIIELFQRTALIRVIDKKEKSYYIDTEGRIMPLSERYTARVVVANGNISSDYFKKQVFVANPEIPDTLNDQMPLFDRMFYLVKYISENKFWNSQIEQIYVNDNMEFELIPKVGDHLIIFGGVEEIGWKFRKLEALYKNVFGKIGWNRYNTINLKYSKQVVCLNK